MTKDIKKITADKDEAMSYDFTDFEQRLQESRHDYDRTISESVFYKAPQADRPLVTADIPAAAAPIKQTLPSNLPLTSSLLASLEAEAKISLNARQNVDQDKQARDHAVHEALHLVFSFLCPFAEHVNNMEPPINRVYRLDARTVFDKLKWQGATVDTRKQSLADSAYFSYVAFSVNLLAPEDLMIMRPWNQLEALKKELRHLRLRTLDDLDEIHRRPKQEWLQARLDPALPVQLIFQGNYALGKIDLLAINLQDFGRTAFILDSTDITAELMDELGIFLIGRSENPPALLCVAE